MNFETNILWVDDPVNDDTPSTYLCNFDSTIMNDDSPLRLPQELIISKQKSDRLKQENGLTMV